jgi:hypothetical protein
MSEYFSKSGGICANWYQFCSTCGTAVLEERKDVPADMRFAVNVSSIDCMWILMTETIFRLEVCWILISGL